MPESADTPLNISELHKLDIGSALALHTGASITLAGASTADSSLAVSTAALPEHLSATIWSQSHPLAGVRVDWQGISAAVVWWSRTQGLSLTQLLPTITGLRKPDTSFLDFLQLKDGSFFVGSYNLNMLPVFSPSQQLKDAALARGIADLQDNPDLLCGLNFSGKLTIGTPFSDPFVELLLKDSVPVQGRIWADAEEQVVSVSIRWDLTKTVREDVLIHDKRSQRWVTTYPVRLEIHKGTDWAIEFTTCAIDGIFTPSTYQLDTLQVGGLLTLAGHKVEISAFANLAGSVLELAAIPQDFKIDMSWLQTLAGASAFQSGGGAILGQGIGKAALTVESLSAVIQWSKHIRLDSLELQISTGGTAAPWKLFGGDFVADLTVRCAFPQSGATLDAMLDGTWTWDGLEFQTALSTADGDFSARILLQQTVKDKQKVWMKKWLLQPGQEKALEATAVAAKAEQLADAHMDAAFTIDQFEVEGNYHDKSIRAGLYTSGSLKFPFGKSASTELRIGGLWLQGEYSDQDWRVALNGRIVLLKNGKQWLLGDEGVAVSGELSKLGGTKLTFNVPRFQLGQFIADVAGIDCPASIRQWELRDIQLHYESGRRFLIAAATDEAIAGDVKLSDISLDVAMEHVEDAGTPKQKTVPTGAQGQVTLTLGSAGVVNLNLELRNGSWVFSGKTGGLPLDVVLHAFRVSGAANPSSDIGSPLGIKIEQLEIDLRFYSEAERATMKDAEKAEASILLQFSLTYKNSRLSMLLVAQKRAGKWRVIFAGDLELQAKFLPLVSDYLKATDFGIALHLLYLSKEDTAYNFEDLQLIASNKLYEGWRSERLDRQAYFKAAIPGLDQIKKLQDGGQGQADPAIKKDDGKDVSSLANTAPPQGTKLDWTPIGKRYGPITIGRIGYGLDMAHKKAVMALDAALDISVLRFGVIGLGLELDLTNFHITPHLEGLSLQVQNGPITVSGALAWRNGVYIGTAQVRASKFTLSAIGRFSIQSDGRASFFLFCVAESTLGGPPAFFIEGFAGGMGYDTALVMPTVEKVPQFSLITAARDGLAQSESAIAAFDRDIQTSHGSMWFAAGVKFSSFKMVDTTAVLVLSIGNTLEIDLFGITRLQLPRPIAGKSIRTLADISIAIRGRLTPSKGEAWIRGLITPGSYVFDPACHISGGFAFQVWFDGPNKGDFVATVGGFHPNFIKPPHYFDVPRLAIGWQVTDNLLVKGSAYFALTSRAVMAGGHLEMLWVSGSTRVSFVADAHFLASWAPLHYQADLSVYVDARCRIKVWFVETEISIHLGAALHLEGPPFHGRAIVDLGVLTVTITFGKAEPVPALPWDEFRDRMLPSQIVTTRFVGLLETESSKAEKLAQRKKREAADTHAKRLELASLVSEVIVVPGQDWEIVVETAMPATRIVVLDHQPDHAAAHPPRVLTTFHAQPMERNIADTTIKLTSIRKQKDPHGDKDLDVEVPWKDLQEALLLDEPEFLSSMVAPALWLPKKAIGADGRDPRLSVPRPSEADLGFSGLVLRSKRIPQQGKLDDRNQANDVVLPDLNQRKGWKCSTSITSSADQNQLPNLAKIGTLDMKEFA